MAKRSKLQIGDLFTIQTPKGKAYIQYVFSDRSDIEYVRVLEGIYNNEPKNLSEIVEKKELYCTGFILKAAYNKKIVEFVGNFPVPTHFQKPQFMMDIMVIGDEFLGWHIVNTETLQRQLVKELNDEQKKMSHYGVVNDTWLIDQITSGWTPEKDAAEMAKRLKK